MFTLDMCKTNVFIKALCVNFLSTYENKLLFMKMLVSVNEDRISNVSMLPLCMVGKSF